MWTQRDDSGSQRCAQAGVELVSSSPCSSIRGLRVGSLQGAGYGCSQWAVTLSP